MNKYRSILLNLGMTLKNSDAVAQNGAQIARVLFELSENFKVAGEEILKYMDQSEIFFDSLSIEMKAINDGFNNIETNRPFIQERLTILENNVPRFHAQLKSVITALSKTHERSLHAQEYLMTGEKEAQKVLNDHWIGNIANYEDRKRVEKELKQVRYVLELLKNMMPNLLDFESFLNKYRKQLQNVRTEIENYGAILMPSSHEFEYLTKAVEKLEISHKKFMRIENYLGQKPTNFQHFEDEMRECTEFDIEFNKSNNVYLKKLRIWSSHLINAIAFFYSDDSVIMFGTPGSGQPLDFEWYKDEKIKRIEYSSAALVYGFKITTTKGRNTEWYGGNGGRRFYTETSGREFNGLFGSFSKYICSLQISHGKNI